MGRKRIAVIVLIAGFTLRHALAAPPDASAVWIEEFAALRAHMAAHYANLDWMVEHRGLDRSQWCDEGAPARLDRIGATVLMPNCARFTSDGVNETEGIDPDVALSLSEGTAAERLGRLSAALAAIR